MATNAALLFLALDQDHKQRTGRPIGPTLGDLADAADSMTWFEVITILILLVLVVLGGLVATGKIAV